MKKTVRDIDVSGKRVLLRVDYNVPLDPGSGVILDDTRIRATLPTIDYLRQRGARIILASHLGRPKGRDPHFSLWPVAERLQELIDAPIKTTGCCVGPLVQEMAHALEPSELLLLENLRFHDEEEANDAEYAKALASLAEVFVNDAFGAAHRAHASTAGVAAFLPAVAGFLMEKEIRYLSHVLINPEHPYAAVIGGAKISSKIRVLKNLLDRVDKLLIGGGMANTFLKAEGFQVGESLVEDDYLEEARSIITEAQRRGVALLLPADVVVAKSLVPDSPVQRVAIKNVPPGWRIVDIGDTTLDVFTKALEGCRTVIWNGPMGVAEVPAFSHGSHRLAAIVSALPAAITIVGGGETAAIVEALGYQDRFSHISTGGGATLEFLEGRELPGVAVLLDA